MVDNDWYVYGGVTILMVIIIRMMIEIITMILVVVVMIIDNVSGDGDVGSHHGEMY